jgi:hypothetical protein
MNKENNYWGNDLPVDPAHLSAWQGLYGEANTTTNARDDLEVLLCLKHYHMNSKRLRNWRMIAFRASSPASTSTQFFL